jgi:potassium channel subfamily K
MSDPLDEPIKQAADELDLGSPERRGQNSKRRDSGDLGEERDYTNPK